MFGRDFYFAEDLFRKFEIWQWFVCSVELLFVQILFEINLL